MGMLGSGGGQKRPGKRTRHMSGPTGQEVSESALADLDRAAANERMDWSETRASIELTPGHPDLDSVEGLHEAGETLLRAVRLPCPALSDAYALLGITRRLLDLGRPSSRVLFLQGSGYYAVGKFALAANSFKESDRLAPNSCYLEWLDSLRRAGMTHEAALVEGRQRRWNAEIGLD